MTGSTTAISSIHSSCIYHTIQVAQAYIPECNSKICNTSNTNLQDQYFINTIKTKAILKHFQGSHVHKAAARYWPIIQLDRGEGTVTLYATPNPFLLNKICLNQSYCNALHQL